MKQRMIVLLSAAISALSAVSCGIGSAQPPKTALSEVIWERLLYKNELERIEKAAFSAKGERFLVWNGFKDISLWVKPFSSPKRKISIEDYRHVVDLRFFGNQQDVFVGYTTGIIQLWDKDMQVAKFEYKFPFTAGSRESDISPDSRFIAWHGALYDRQKKSLVGRPAGHAMDTGICFGGSSLLLTSGYHDRSIAVRNIFSGQLEYRTVPYPVTGGAISPNEKYAVAVTPKGCGYLWNWPDNDPEVLPIPWEAYGFGGFSPDSRWLAIAGDESLYVYRSERPMRIAHLDHAPGITSVFVASNNLIVIGDRKGEVLIFDVSANKVIGRQKVLSHGVSPVELHVDNGYLWAAATRSNLEIGEQSEIALYHVKGLEPYIEPGDTTRKK